VLGKLDLAWALKNKHLAQPKYHILTDDIDVQKLSNIKNGLTKSELDKTLFLHKRDDEIIRIINEQLRAAGVADPRCIVFCKNIRHINNFLNHLPPGTATIIHSKMSRDNQRKAISDFREGSFKFILTVDIFNEGVDIPEVNSLVFLRSTSSKTIWLQQLGRGLRKTPEKNFVEVFDFVGSVNRILEVEELKKDVQKSSLEGNSSSDKDDEETNEDCEPKEIVHDSQIEVAYSKYAAEVQKLLEQYQFKINTRQDCVDELIRISRELNRIPNQIEIVDGIKNITIDQFVTIFNDYWNAISVVFADNDTAKFEKVVNDKIIDVGNYHAGKFKVIPSPEMVQLETMISGLPLASVPYIREVIKGVSLEQVSPPDLPEVVIAQKVSRGTALA
jgi:superfamily II DNA or RNA helicase